MSELEHLTKHWVEIAEESTPERIVLKPMSENIPPARGGRRWLDLSGQKRATAFSAGTADEMVPEHGEWNYEDGQLKLNTSGWTGEYEIEQINEEILVIVPKQ